MTDVTAEEVDIPELDDDEIEDVAGAETVESTEDKTPKEPAKPKRGDLPEIEGDEYIAPVAWAKVLSQPLDGNAENTDDDNYRYTHSKTGSHVVAPQMVYSYIRSSKDGKNPLPTYTVTDSNGTSRENILKLNEANEWWDEKAGRAEARAKAQADKEKAKAEKAAAAPTTPVADAAVADSGGEVTEAE